MLGLRLGLWLGLVISPELKLAIRLVLGIDRGAIVAAANVITRIYPYFHEPSLSFCSGM